MGAVEFDLRENEAISVEPIWVLGVEGHKLVEEDVSGWSQAHWSPGVTGVRLEGGIDLDKGTTWSARILNV